MAKKQGVCINIDCENYKKTIDVETGAEMVCPCCGQALKPMDKGTTGGKSPKSKVPIIAAIAAVVLAGGGYGIYALTSGGEEKSVETAVVEPEQSVETDTIAKSVAPVEPVASAEPVVAPEAPAVKPAPKKSPSKVLNGRGTVDLGYASYTGDLKNGKPHGYGVLTYKTSHKIVSSKDFVANPGDTFEGDFRDGRISGLGYWKHGGNTTAVKP